MKQDRSRAGNVHQIDTYQPRQTVLKRMGGMPSHVLSVGGLSDRDMRRSVIAERIRDHTDRSKSCS
ncbi:MAG: hypothetical protein AAGF93_06810 [Cyanobacteria bacterium P01_H01_bin.105]